MRSFSRAEKGFLFGLIATPTSAILSFFLPSFMNYVLIPIALLGLAFFTFGGLISAFESSDRGELEEAYRSQQ